MFVEFKGGMQEFPVKDVHFKNGALFKSSRVVMRKIGLHEKSKIVPCT